MFDKPTIYNLFLCVFYCSLLEKCDKINTNV